MALKLPGHSFHKLDETGPTFNGEMKNESDQLNI